MKRSGLIIIGMVVALISGFIGFQFQQQQKSTLPDKPYATGTNKQPEKNLIGQMRPEFSLHDMDGIVRNVQEWDNKVVVINFWATWCPPCREEIPGFIRLQNQYANEGLQFIGIALQSAAEVEEFVMELGLNYPVLVGLDDVIKVAEAYGNQAGVLPYTVIIDRDRKISFTRKGPLHYEEAEAAILAVL